MTDPAKIERITRSLAFMLRHQPEQFDLELDRYGNAYLDDVVRALNERLGEPIDRTDVEAAIGAGGRQRYEIEGDRIRALYGHSIEVDPGESSRPPEGLYLALPGRDVDRALRFGLRGGRRRFLHLALTVDDARETGRRLGRDYTILSIRALDAWEEGVDFYDRYSLWLAEEVPTHLIDEEGSYDDGTDPRERMRRDDGRRRPRGRGERGRSGRSRSDRPRADWSRGDAPRGDWNAEDEEQERAEPRPTEVASAAEPEEDAWGRSRANRRGRSPEREERAERDSSWDRGPERPRRSSREPEREQEREGRPQRARRPEREPRREREDEPEHARTARRLKGRRSEGRSASEPDRRPRRSQSSERPTGERRVRAPEKSVERSPERAPRKPEPGGDRTGREPAREGIGFGAGIVAPAPGSPVPSAKASRPRREPDTDDPVGSGEDSRGGRGRGARGRSAAGAAREDRSAGPSDEPRSADVPQGRPSEERAPENDAPRGGFGAGL